MSNATKFVFRLQEKNQQGYLMLCILYIIRLLETMSYGQQFKTKLFRLHGFQGTLKEEKENS